MHSTHKSLWFDLSQCLCNRYHDIRQRWEVITKSIFMWDWLVKDASCHLRNEQLMHFLWFISIVRFCSIYIQDVYVDWNVPCIAPNAIWLSMGFYLVVCTLQRHKCNWAELYSGHISFKYIGRTKPVAISASDVLWLIEQNRGSIGIRWVMVNRTKPWQYRHQMSYG